MNRIKMKDLEILVDRLNRIKKTPMEPWSKCNDKKSDFKGNIGNYHIDSAYGGHKLVQMSNINGGIKKITYGYITKRELYEKLTAMITIL